MNLNEIVKQYDKATIQSCRFREFNGNNYLYTFVIRDKDGEPQHIAVITDKNRIIKTILPKTKFTIRTPSNYTVFELFIIVGLVEDLPDTKVEYIRFIYCKDTDEYVSQNKGLINLNACIRYTTDILTDRIC